MRMGPDNNAGTAVDVPGKRHLFCGRFGVEIDERNFGLLIDLAERPVDGTERIVDRLHIGPPLQIDYSRFHAAFQFIDRVSDAGGAVREVQRSKKMTKRRVDLFHIPTVERVVSPGDDMYAKIEELFDLRLFDPLSVRNVFAVRNAEIDLVLFQKTF